MKTAIFRILATLLACALTGSLFAQGETAAPPYRLELRPLTAAAPSDGSAEFELTVVVSADCAVSNTLVSGCDMEAFVDGEKKFRFLAAIEGDTRLLAGTRLMRKVTADLKLVFGGVDSVDGLKTVTMRWGGQAGVEAPVMVYPDQAGIDLDRLDYAKTRVTLVTNYGDMTLMFEPEMAPNHVRNFVKLARDGFYNGTQFHRVIQGFMIQGGCPNTKPGATGQPGTGDAGYKIDAEFNSIKHVRGVLSAARSRDPNSAGSQFFIMHGEATHLDGQYTAYGRLETGFETLDKIATTPVRGSTPIEPAELFAAIVIPAYKE